MFGLILYFVTFLVIFPFNLYKNQIPKIIKPVPELKKVLSQKPETIETQKITLTPTSAPITPTLTPVLLQTSTNTPSPSQNQTWGVSEQVGSDTYTVKVQNDSQMATPQEILTALNNYRSVHGKGILSWDNNLADFAQSRSDQFNKDGKLDDHAGFNQLFSNPDNVKKLGFLKLGENSSIGYTLDAVHIIEWVYASDAPHNNNQLDSDWTYVGIGVSGNSTDLVFGGSKI
jgi:uncharacterized protein YkwD